MTAPVRKALIRDTFNTVATGYDKPALRYFVDSAQHLVQSLNLRGDERVLDVAAGTGSNALCLAQAVPAGYVTGVDFASGMLQQGRDKAARLDLSNVDFVEMDMQNLSFDHAQFDVATCAFGIFFVDEMEVALQHIASKVKPDGKVAVSSFADTAFLPLVELFFARLVQFGIAQPPLAWKRIAAEENLTALFASAELQNITVQRKNMGYYLSDANEWWDLIWYAGFRALVNQLEPPQLAQFKVEHLAEIQQLATAEGIWLDVEVLYAVGVK